jgi:hypothetical protein
VRRQPAQCLSILPDSPKSISFGEACAVICSSAIVRRGNGGLSGLEKELKWNRLKFKQERPSQRR